MAEAVLSGQNSYTRLRLPSLRALVRAPVVILRHPPPSQAEQAAELRAAAPGPVRAQPSRPAALPADAPLPGPNEPERRPDPRAPGRTLHELAAPWTPNEPEADDNYGVMTASG